VSITAVGAVSAVGRSAVETCASVRAGICRFGEWPRYIPLTSDPKWEKPDPFVASVVADLPAAAPGPARMAELSTRALRDLVASVPIQRSDLARASLFLALPEHDAATKTWDLGPAWGPRLCGHAGLPAIPVASARAEGSAGSLAILGDVQQHLQRSPSELALVVFVDSYLDGERLRAIDADARLKSGRTTDGLVPGEAAVAMVLESGAGAGRETLAPLALLAGVGVGQEPQIRSSDKESSGQGLTMALRGALVGSPPNTSRWCLCDLNGQSYRAAEWGVSSTRLAAELAGLKRLSHPADCLGDVGAATGGMLIALAMAGFARGYARAEEALLWASSSEHGLRAACRVLPATGGAL
jgi:3-oxoacyl-[acyl-carrier-protein] synthase-1